MKKEITYIGFYDLPNQEFKRVSSPAAINKMEYICDALSRVGYSVHLVSPSWFDDSACAANYHSETMIQLGEKKRVTLCPSFGTSSKWTRNLKIVLSLIWLFLWILFHIDSRDKILMYHTPWLSLPVRFAKKLIRFKLVLEVEEIYADVSSIHPYFDQMEKKLISAADAYLFATELLTERIGREKPFVIIYGVYANYEKRAEPVNDGKIHLLYAGIIDSKKGGAFKALESTHFLSCDYILHIIGFGETERLCEQIHKLNMENGCRVVYDGIKSGNEYIRYSQSCHIGLNTQKMNGSYLNSSFPSKILSYLSMGLQVVSCYVECVAKSKIHSLMNYYENDTPEEIAKAIKSVKLSDGQSCKLLIKKLDEQFIRDLKEILC